MSESDLESVCSDDVKDGMEESSSASSEEEEMVPLSIPSIRPEQEEGEEDDDIDIDEDAMQLGRDRVFDIDISDAMDEIYPIVNPNDVTEICIPFICIRPAFAARRNHDARYRTSAINRPTPGSVSARFRTLGLILGTDGTKIDLRQQMLWEQYIKLEDINDTTGPDFTSSTFMSDLTDAQLNSYEQRCLALEEIYMDRVVNLVNAYDPTERHNTYNRYNFGIYEHLARDPETKQVVRSWRFLGIEEKFYHDVFCPMYKLIYYVGRYGFSTQGYELFLKQLKSNNKPGDNLLNTDLSLQEYERLCLKTNAL